MLTMTENKKITENKPDVPYIVFEGESPHMAHIAKIKASPSRTSLFLFLYGIIAC